MQKFTTIKRIRYINMLDLYIVSLTK